MARDMPRLTYHDDHDQIQKYIDEADALDTWVYSSEIQTGLLLLILHELRALREVLPTPGHDGEGK